jgi:hypothetical protein
LMVSDCRVCFLFGGQMPAFAEPSYAGFAPAMLCAWL